MATKKRRVLMGVTLSFILLLSACVLWTASVGKAEAASPLTFTLINHEGGQAYKVSTRDKANITEAVIPGYYNNLPVVEVADNGFMSCKKLVKVTIPETVTRVGNNAFYNCVELQDVAGALKVKNWGNTVFLGCVKLDYIAIPKPTALGKAVFKNCTTSVYVRDTKANVMALNANFEDGYAGDEMYYDAKKVAYLPYFENGEIVAFDIAGYQAITGKPDEDFVQYDSFSLEDGQPAKPIRYIGANAFANLTCKTFTLKHDTNLDVLPDKPTLTVFENAFFSMEDTTDIVIESDITLAENCDSLFTGCTALERITLPDTLTEIPNSMFYDCIALEQISYVNNSVAKNHLSDKIVKIGESAFANCYSMPELYIPPTVQQVSDAIFDGWGLENSTPQRIVIEKSSEEDPQWMTKNPLWKSGLYTDDTFTQLNPNVTVDYQIRYLFKYVKNTSGYTLAGFSDWVDVSKITEISIPVYTNENKKITRIGASAFENTALTKVKFEFDNYRNNYITHIEEKAFYNCQNLTDFDSSVAPLNAIGAHAFENTAITRFGLSNALSEIGESAFENCKNLTEIAGANNSTYALSIKSRGFYGCENLQYVSIGSDSVYIGHSAFYNCKSLRRVEMTTIYLSEYAFYGTGGFEFVAECGDIPAHAFENSRVYNITTTQRTQTIDESAFKNCENLQLTSAAVTSDVRIIMDSAFENCAGLLQAEFPNVHYIGAKAFYNCESLFSMTFGADFTSIPESAFENCKNLERFAISDRLKEIHPYAFRGCENLEFLSFEPYELHKNGIYLPNGVLIGKEAFAGCKKIKSVEITDYMFNADDGAFKDCSALIVARLPINSNDLIGKGIFEGCTNLTVLEAPYNGIIGNYFWNDTTKSYMDQEGLIPLRDFTITNRTYGIDEGSFYGCRKLRTVLYPNGDYMNYINTIGNFAFANSTIEYFCPTDTKIEEYKIIIPQSVLRIGAAAFQNCTSIKIVKLDSGVTEIDNFAFQNCTALTKVEFVSLNSIKTIGDSAFENCGVLSVSPIGENVEAIGESAFKDCSSIRTLNLSLGLTAIGKSAFMGCTKVDSVSMPSTVTKIEDDTFNGCVALKTVSTGNVTTIGNRAFNGCSSLKTLDLNVVDTIGDFAFCSTNLSILTLYESLLSIGNNAFANNGSLTQVQVRRDALVNGTITEIGEKVFDECTNLTLIKVPESSFGEYKNAANWNHYASLMSKGL